MNDPYDGPPALQGLFFFVGHCQLFSDDIFWHADVQGHDDWMMQPGDDASEGSESESSSDSEPDYDMDMDKVCCSNIQKR
jgi:hypothetical protein